MPFSLIKSANEITFLDKSINKVLVKLITILCFDIVPSSTRKVKVTAMYFNYLIKACNEFDVKLI